MSVGCVQLSQASDASVAWGSCGLYYGCSWTHGKIANCNSVERASKGKGQS